MAKLEASAETENRLKLDLKSVTSQLCEMTSARELERGELEGRLGELVQEKKQLTEIMREKIEEGKRLQAQVRLPGTGKHTDRQTDEEIDSNIM